MQRNIGEEAKAKLQNAHDLILKDFQVHYRIPQLSKIVDLDEPTLKYGFKQLYGQGPFKFLTIARLEQAANLLKETDLPIAQIARKCGYNHATNMTAAFRRQFNVLPSDLRKKAIA
ncbi:AraC family transcriptional regulator [Paraflavitalea sp. CAU 1676]|uniref:helix-turn-helix transcriptional regulator n=1 Tax=Paraflavitalea sp. CAU 1676 TaxID=3032598 RepID=UPI0023DA27DA|nr:AraC family transcriptional regulator [Paraflavitalea sp. CAU 1676]MDF2190521.1 AraC family transcriptional regulator [Paraflavitalea sp. CAU 1676]